MTELKYPNGVAIEAGDRARYHGEAAVVLFTKTVEADGREDFFVEEGEGGGVMIDVDGLGNIFLGLENLSDLEESEFSLEGRTPAHSND